MGLSFDTISRVESNCPSQAQRFLVVFSGKNQGFVYGEQHYHWHRLSERAILNQLYELYQREGVVMPDTIENFERDFTREHLHLSPPEEQLTGLPPEERLKGLPVETILKQLSLEDRFKRLSPEVIKAYLRREFLKLKIGNAINLLGTTLDTLRKWGITGELSIYSPFLCQQTRYPVTDADVIH